MKKHFLTIGLALGAFATAHGQAKVGTNPATINTDAVLELESASKGLLMPRVALTSLTSFAPLSAHVAGMTVYNTTSAGTGNAAVTPGIYYNNGTAWTRLSGMVSTRTGSVYVGDMGGSPVGTLTPTGDFASATKANFSSKSEITMTFTNAMPNADYLVQATLEGVTNAGGNQDLKQWLIYSKTASGFVLVLTETAATGQDIRVRFKITDQ